MRVKNLARDTIAVLSKRLKSMTLRSATRGDNWPQPDIHPRLQTSGACETNVNRPPEGIHPMESHRLELFADYFQFYLQDATADGDLSDAWDDAATRRMLVVSTGVVGMGTARNMKVPVTLEILEAKPSLALDSFDHVVEGSLVVTTGPLVIAGCTDYLPDAQRFGVQPGTLRVRLSASGLNSLSTDGLEGDDHYLVQLWPDAPIEPVVLKQWED